MPIFTCNSITFAFIDLASNKPASIIFVEEGWKSNAIKIFFILNRIHLLNSFINSDYKAPEIKVHRNYKIFEKSYMIHTFSSGSLRTHRMTLQLVS